VSKRAAELLVGIVHQLANETTNADKYILEMNNLESTMAQQPEAPFNSQYWNDLSHP
jgi:hypothetical protein